MTNASEWEQQQHQPVESEGSKLNGFSQHFEPISFWLELRAGVQA